MELIAVASIISFISIIFAVVEISVIGRNVYTDNVWNYNSVKSMHDI